MAGKAKTDFDKIVDFIMKTAKDGTIEGKFDYRSGNRASGSFTCDIDGSKYAVSIQPVPEKESFPK